MSSTVLIDNTGQNATALSATTLTIGSFAVGSGVNRCIYLAVSQWKASDLQPTATFNGTENFVVHDSVTTSETPGTRRITLFKLVNPSNVTANIVVTWGSAVDEAIAGATSWTGVDQVSPFSAAVKNSSNSAVSLSVVVPNAIGDVVHAAISADASGSAGITSNQTQRWRAISGGSTSEGAGQSATGTGSNIALTFGNITGGIGENSAMIGVAIQQAGTPRTVIYEAWNSLSNWFGGIDTVASGILTASADGQLVCKTPLTPGDLWYRFVWNAGSTTRAVLVASSDGASGDNLGICIYNSGTSIRVATLDHYTGFTTFQSDSSTTDLVDLGIAWAANISIGVTYERATKIFRFWASSTLAAMPDSPTSWGRAAPAGTYDFHALGGDFVDYGNFCGIGADTAGSPHPQYGAFTAGDFSGRIAHAQFATYYGVNPGTASFAANMSAGSVIAGYLWFDSNGALASVKIGTTDADAIIGPLTLPGGLTAYAFYFLNVAGGTKDVVATASPNDGMHMTVTEITGFVGGGALDRQHFSSNASSTTIDSGNITTTAAIEFLYGFGVGDTNFVGSPGPGWTSENTNNTYAQTQYQIVSSAGTYASTLTIGAASTNGGWIMAFKDAGGSPVALGPQTSIDGQTASTGTSGAINTTGMKLLLVAVGYYASPGTPPTITDSKGNTWHALTVSPAGPRNKVQLFYAWNPIVGSGHTFTVTHASLIYFSAEIAAFGGIQTAADPFDVQNGGVSAAAGTSVASGSITPSAANELVIAAMGIDDPAGSAITLPSGYTLIGTLDDIVGARFGVSLAYAIQSAATATNPTWTRSAGSTQSGDAAVVASFRAPSAVGYQKWGLEDGTGAWQLETGAGYWLTEASDPASGGTTFSHTASGGIASGGHSAANVSRVARAPTGGAQSSGHAPAAIGKSVFAAGGASIAGHSTLAVRRAAIAAGGALVAGSSTLATRRAAVAAGGASIAGVSRVSTQRTASAVGGVQTSGHAPTSVSRVARAPTGGATIGGSALASTGTVFQFSASGGVQTGGHAIANTRRSALASGGALVSGHSALAVGYRPHASGGITAAGAAAVGRGRGYRASGGAQAGGQSAFSVRYAYAASSGAQTGGAATVTFAGIMSYRVTATGGVSLAGSAAAARRRTFQPSGGIVTSGTSLSAFARSYAHLGSGGVTIAGRGAPAVARRVTATGGFAIDGTASASYVSGAIVAAALTGLVLVFPRYDGRVLVAAQLEGRVSASALLDGTIDVLPDHGL